MSAEDAITEGVFTLMSAGPMQLAYEFEGAAAEVLASKESAHIGTALHNGTPVYDVSCVVSPPATWPKAPRGFTGICVRGTGSTPR